MFSINYYNKILNSKSWGDIMLDLDDEPIQQVTNQRQEELKRLALDGLIEIQKLYKESCEIDEKLNKIIDELDKQQQVSNTLINEKKFEQEYTEFEKWYAGLESNPVQVELDDTHYAVIEYIIADRKCSHIWKKFNEKQQEYNASLKRTADRKQLINILYEWVQASKDRFAAMTIVESIGKFDFDLCFERLFPEEVEDLRKRKSTHTKDMKQTYYFVTKKLINSLKV